jgi:Fe-S-cluster-containing hydrogenase component 2
VITTDSPLNSLRTGRWFKLICGASYQHLPSVRNLTLAYTLAGADCIDVAADPAVIAATRAGLAIADRLGEEARERGFGYRRQPWLMVSLNDGEDPHFRKAEFDATACPPGCPRPCETICPAGAIAFSELESGVIDRLCYGCGRCIPVCPADLIHARSYVFTPGAVAPLVFQTGADAIEIHTQIGREADFERLWNQIRPQVHRLKAIAVSCPDGPDVIGYLQTLHQILSPLPPDTAPIWQADGRPMSGDIGAGTTRAAVRLGRRILEARLPGYVQLAGGTNDYTVAKLRSEDLLPPSRRPTVAGVAYGSYARSLLSPLLDSAELMPTNLDGMPAISQLEAQPDRLWTAVGRAHALVSQLKGF